MPMLREMIALPLRLGALVRRSAGTQALVLVAAMAIAQSAIMGLMLASQHDGARIVNINGAQRMRTQRVAYLALAARSAKPPADWRPELHGTIDDALRVRAELLARTDPLPASPGHLSGVAAAGMMLAYADAARRIEGNPRDDAAYDFISTTRLPLLRALDWTVEARSNMIDARNTRLFQASMASAAFMLVTLLAIWWRIIFPTESRTRAVVANLAKSRAQISSLFRENPDAVAMYDPDGHVIDGNRASLALLGQMSSELLGSHFMNHIAPGEDGVAREAFARALAGESVEIDTHFRDAQSDSIAVRATLFPNVIEGEVVGVVGIARDTRALRRAEAAYQSQTDRITELYRVAAYQNKSWERQVRETLAVAATRLGYEWAVATELSGGDARPIAFVDKAGERDAASFTMSAGLVDFVQHEGDAWTIDDRRASALQDVSLEDEERYAALAGSPLVIGSTPYGAIVLGAHRPRTVPFTESDRDFLRLVSALISLGIGRGHHESKLDALAFFDALTALPNRVLLNDRMTEHLMAAARQQRSFAVHFIDLDRFKAINDRYGHATGDDVLRIVARRMESVTRENDTIARLGGDEFVILQRLDEDGRGARGLADRILTVLAKPMRIDDVEHSISASIGISIYPNDALDAPSLMARADEALLRAKRAGRNRPCFAAA